MIEYSLLDDNELQILAVSGDKNAEEQLASRYMRLVKVCARPYFLAGGDSEDLIQEGMFGLLSAIRQYDPGRDVSFRSFAELCVRNRVISAVKTASSNRHLPLNDRVSIDDLIADESQIPLTAYSVFDRRSPEEQVLARESEENSRILYSNFIKQLSKFETIVLDRYLKGLSYREIADETGKTAKAVDNAIQRIRRKLAHYLNSGDFSIS